MLAARSPVCDVLFRRFVPRYAQPRSVCALALTSSLGWHLLRAQASVLPPAAGGVLSARVKPRLVAPHALSLKTRLRGGEQKTSGLPIADSTDDLQDAVSNACR